MSQSAHMLGIQRLWFVTSSYYLCCVFLYGNKKKKKTSEEGLSSVRRGERKGWVQRLWWETRGPEVLGDRRASASSATSASQSVAGWTRSQKHRTGFRFLVGFQCRSFRSRLFCEFFCAQWQKEKSSVLGKITTSYPP